MCFFLQAGTSSSFNPTHCCIIGSIARFDDVHHCLESTLEIELTPQACSQAQLGLKYGGLGLSSLTMHAQAAYIASLSTSLTPICPSELTMQRLCDAIMVFNGKVACCEQLSVEGVQVTRHHQHKLSSAIKKAGFLSLLGGASTVDNTRLLAISVPQANAWPRAQPLGLDLLPNEVQALIKWWLGLPLFTDLDACPHCSQPLDIHGHHALICRSGASMTSGYTAELGEQGKHSENDIPCIERGWVCVPLVVEVFCGWGNKAQEAFSRVAKKLAIRTCCFWPEVLASMYCHLGIMLMHQNARALLGRRDTSEVDIV